MSRERDFSVKKKRLIDMQETPLNRDVYNAFEKWLALWKNPAKVGLGFKLRLRQSFIAGYKFREEQGNVVSD